ncbi:AAA family ATPase [Paenibacillus hexagrammi]|uniref:Flp pilus assembly protein, ATPase CpaE n=1 Tax=Paenibacillus hexagrammi TaxID=2908839 RepID=A0ABY3SGF6_9BACL|nr:hypothetical protein [Paenibacillus sp. YPD9-1]UJF32548.1 hypothetical protein L0M14_23285 [Paenibacillus sp. YPD9-1]
MQALLLSTDDRLADELTNVVFKENMEWMVCESVDGMEQALACQSYTHFILSDRHLDFVHMQELLERCRNEWPSMKIMVLLSNYHDAAMNSKYMKMCKLHKLDYVQPGRGTAVIADLIRAWVEQPEADLQYGQGKILAFVGSTPNIGTTLTSFGTAYCLAEETSSEVGYLCLNLKSSKLHRYLGRDEKVFTLDSLRAELKSQTLTPQRLRQVCEQMREAPGLYVLFGNMLREQAEFFTPSEIDHLLRTARSAFDICVIEVNAYWDNAATVCGLLEADTRIAVTTPDLAQFQEDFTRWIKQVGTVFGLQSDTFELVTVQMDKLSRQHSFTSKDIRKETQLHLIGEVSKHGDALPLCNQGKLLELFHTGHAMRKEVSTVASKLADFYQWPQRQQMKRKPWLKRLLTGSTVT